MHDLPGGGGYGDPFACDPQRVLDDLVNDYVSIKAALRDYDDETRDRDDPIDG